MGIACGVHSLLYKQTTTSKQASRFASFQRQMRSLALYITFVPDLLQDIATEAACQRQYDMFSTASETQVLQKASP